jgi:hypothetical protein
VSLRDVPAFQALRAVMAEANLSFAAAPFASPYPRVVFYRRPVNVDSVEVEAIRAAFGVSKELAEFIVLSRTKRPDR